MQNEWLKERLLSKNITYGVRTVIMPEHEAMRGLYNDSRGFGSNITTREYTEVSSMRESVGQQLAYAALEINPFNNAFFMMGVVVAAYKKHYWVNPTPVSGDQDVYSMQEPPAWEDLAR